MICDFMPFSTVFQPYQDNGRVILDGCEKLEPQASH